MLITLCVAARGDERPAVTLVDLKKAVPGIVIELRYATAHFKFVSPEVYVNRKLLQDAMTNHGFAPYESEWWHFDDADWQTYPALDLPMPAR